MARNATPIEDRGGAPASAMLNLRHATPPAWVDVVLNDIGSFLQDHAANERKVSASALWIAVHFPSDTAVVDAMIELATEELAHFRQVYALLRRRGLGLGQDSPDPYMGQVHKLLRRAVVREHLLDRLLAAAIVEARGHERFAMLAPALADEELGAFYRRLVAAEARHHGTLLDLALGSFTRTAVEARLDQLLDAEAEIARALPLRPALH